MQKNEIDKIKEKLIQIFKDESAVCTTINGKWGVGKTYFWHKFVEDNSKELNKSFVYISLFGKDSISQITQEIILQTYKKYKMVSNFLDKFKKSNIDKIIDKFASNFGSAIIGCISLFEKKDFENIVICFDDFERLSNKLSIKDVVGLISELKEQKNCHIVMIFNAKELKLDDIKRYKDKIVDYEFNYKPTAENTYKIIEDKLKVFKDYPLEYFKKHNINNIRIMKRVVTALNDFGFLEKDLKDFKYTEQILVKDIMEIATINALKLNMNFKELDKYSFKYFTNNLKDNEKNKEFDEVIEYAQRNYLEPSDIREEIISYITKSITDDEKIRYVVNIIKFKEDKLKKLDGYMHRLQYDFKLDDGEYCNKIRDFLDDNIDMVYVLGVSNFIFYIEFIKERNPTQADKYHNFAINILKGILENNSYNTILPYNPDIDKILEFDPALIEYDDNLRDMSDRSKISTKEGILDLLKNGNELELEVFEKVDDEKLKQLILNDWEFCFGVISCLNSNFLLYSSCKNLINKFIRIFESINSDKNDIKSIKILNEIKRNYSKK
ncbi:hypothetical protein [Campylobacter concisus]